MVWQEASASSERPFLGRAAERAVIGELLDAVREGLGRALVLTGEAGVGKTRLLRYAADQAGELRVVRLVGIESETRLAYGALHRLLRPLLGGLGRLPRQQRDALTAAFGLTSTAPADRFLAGLATLTLLADASTELPMLCLVDDVHWLDRESAEALAFVARRLHADSLAMVFAARFLQRGVLDGVTEIHLDGLAPDQARALLAHDVAGHLDADVADLIVAGTGGNPLALRQLVAELSSEQLAGGARLPEPLPVSQLLEDHFRRSVATLPEDTRTFLLLLAATPTDDQSTLWRAAGALELSVGSVSPAVACGVLTRGPAVEFRHPLIRSAVYSAAEAGERRRIHAALARTSAPDRQAWHLAEATEGADDAVAAELEAASHRARARGGYSEQALFLSRAAELTTDPAVRADRYLDAAAAHLASGDASSVQTLLDLAAPGIGRPASRVRAVRLRASVEMLLRRPAEIPALMLDALTEVGTDDHAMARDLSYEAMYAAILSADMVSGTTLEQVAKRSADALHDPAAPSWSPVPVMEALATRVTRGYGAAAPLLAASLRRLRDSDEVREYGAPVSVIVSLAADELWDIEAKREIVGRLAAGDRDHGALWGLRLAVVALATAELWDGRFAAAEAYYAQADDFAAATGIPQGSATNRALLYAWTGREPELRSMVRFMTATADATGIGLLNRVAVQAMSILEIGSGRYREALDHALETYTEDTVAHGNGMLATLVEAAVRVGDRSAAVAGLRRVEERAVQAGTPWALGVLARCRALVAEDDGAEKLYLESIDLLGTVPVAVELAWSRLLYGEWLRRCKRRSDARIPLRAAYESFDSWGAAPFAQRARAELLATGETARSRSVKTQFDLTPQERQVAVLAGAGLTNGEIATRLFLTTSTIEYHLNKVFRKLAISSRKQIAEALSRDSEAVEALVR
jgi:DNA-binding CsgD family transcriptional regulator